MIYQSCIDNLRVGDIVHYIYRDDDLEWPRYRNMTFYKRGEKIDGGPYISSKYGSMVFLNDVFLTKIVKK